MRNLFLGLALFTSTISSGAQGAGPEAAAAPRRIPASLGAEAETGEAFFTGMMPLGCREASRDQRAVVEEGNRKRDLFLRRCAEETGGSAWCNQLVRPNPDSESTFRCTYGNLAPHQLIHPAESTWKNAIKSVQIIARLEAAGYRVCEIYNWWRPEPYNQNVGGAAGRHPHGTSVDIRFCSAREAVRGFDELCQYRKRGEVRALGYYGNSGVHLGVGDASANTWGRACR